MKLAVALLDRGLDEESISMKPFWRSSHTPITANRKRRLKNDDRREQQRLSTVFLSEQPTGPPVGRSCSASLLIAVPSFKRHRYSASRHSFVTACEHRSILVPFKPTGAVSRTG